MVGNYRPRALFNKRSQFVNSSGREGPLHETSQTSVVGGVSKEEGAIVDSRQSNVLQFLGTRIASHTLGRFRGVTIEGVG
jgi:hypothetical protein